MKHTVNMDGYTSPYIQTKASRNVIKVKKPKFITTFISDMGLLFTRRNRGGK